MFNVYSFYFIFFNYFLSVIVRNSSLSYLTKKYSVFVFFIKDLGVMPSSFSLNLECLSML